MKLTCKNCKHNYKMLSKEMLCAFCYKKKFNRWSDDFSQGNDSKGNRILVGGNHMKFSRGKEKRPDTGKKISMFRAGN